MRFRLYAVTKALEDPAESPLEIVVRLDKQNVGKSEFVVPFAPKGHVVTVIYVALASVVVSSIAVLLSYNRFVNQRQLIDNSWSNVDSELQRRHDLIPNLVETVKGYAAHEQRTFETVTARPRAGDRPRRGSAAAQSPAENTLVDGMRQLLAVSEAYPDLRASYHFLAAARRARHHREPHPSGAALLQRQRPGLQPPRRLDPVARDRAVFRFTRRGLLRGRPDRARASDASPFNSERDRACYSAQRPSVAKALPDTRSTTRRGSRARARHDRCAPRPDHRTRRTRPCRRRSRA